MPGTLPLPGGLAGVRRHAALQETDDLAREVAEVDKDALLRLERLKVLLADLQGVQQEEVVLTGEVNAQDLQQMYPNP